LRLVIAVPEKRNAYRSGRQNGANFYATMSAAIAQKGAEF